MAELNISFLSDSTLRLTLLPLDSPQKEEIKKASAEGQIKGEPEKAVFSTEIKTKWFETLNGSRVLEKREWPKPSLSLASLEKRTISFKDRKIFIQPSPLTIEIYSPQGKPEQKLVFDSDKGLISFRLGEKPLYGLGGGGQKFDRRGTYDFMNNGHRSGEYQIFGSRVPIPFLLSAEGWALFVHRPYNLAFDLRQEPARLEVRANPRDEKEEALPVDLFLIVNPSPLVILSEYGQITGRPVLPPRWTLGYFQSHRTLTGPEEIITVAETFRKKQLPCDGLIYLGTGYCPAGWNLGHGSLEFNPKTFPDPEKIIRKLHELNFKVVLHKNNAPRTLHGNFPPLPEEKRGPDHVADYWERHRPIFKLGVDGWWPDDGDELPIDSRLARHFIYYAGPLADRPNERPFSLHRTGYAGMQRYGGWVWSGDVYSLWATLAAHVPIGINFSLSASPYWGTDIGGFWPTPEFTGELYVRWFQFMSFAPIFRSHGRVWHLRLPWGWNLGEAGPPEINPDMRGTGLPDPKEFRNPEIEPICRQYLNLRYQLLPYNYTLAREAYDKGLPFIRALWIHYPDDEKALQCGDEYLWGRDILVAPVVEKGATKRVIYLPEGRWYDFWTNNPVMGKQEIIRYVDLSLLPLYVRAGAIIPLGPVIQYTEQPTPDPLTINIYAGADGFFQLYEDDGRSLDYQQGMGRWINFSWKDKERLLRIELDPKSILPLPTPLKMEIRLIPERKSQSIIFEGRPLEIRF
ncbi:MAG: DUF5110 domain-containing protein [Candidatus Aminicenantes bacterium]|nr:DUF5110 domain-containing protein [Candidatus Aminicenantes bacterium]